MNTDALLSGRDAHVSRGVVTAHPIVASKAQGAYIWDTEGRRYLDFVGGIGVQNVGHNHPKVIAAAQAQLQQVTHAAFQVINYEPYIALAARLNRLIGGDEPYKSVFLTTGAEAVENAVKIARAYTNRPAVIAFKGGFHGRTLLGVTLTGMSQPYRQNFGPFPAEIHHAHFPDDYRGMSTKRSLEELEELFATQVSPDRIAAILVEPVQGDGGFRPAPVEFLRELRSIADKNGIVLILDEIQAGFGRTGAMFGFQHAGIQPDLVTVAKSLAGGFPLSGVVGKADIMDAPEPGGLGGTYGGNPIACAAALAVLDVIEEEGLVQRSVELGQQLEKGLIALKQRHPQIGEVRGIGFMRAIEFITDPVSRTPDPNITQRVIEKARDKGLLVIKCGVHRNVIRFLGPLVAEDADVAEALSIVGDAIEEAAGN